VRYLSGPIAVEGAEPGDILVVDIVDIGALATSPWGFTGIFAKTNGGSFLTDHYPDAKKTIWDLQGIYAVSRHIKGVKLAGLSHPGLIGCAPSAELLAMWNKREAELIATNPNRVPPLAAPPNPQAALAGKLQGAAAERVAKEGARTVPPREHGAIATSRTYRAVHGSTSRCMLEGATCRWGLSTGRREMGRSHSVAPSRCQAIWALGRFW